MIKKAHRSKWSWSQHRHPFPLRQRGRLRPESRRVRRWPQCLCRHRPPQRQSPSKPVNFSQESKRKRLRCSRPPRTGGCNPPLPPELPGRDASSLREAASRAPHRPAKTTDFAPRIGPTRGGADRDFPSLRERRIFSVTGKGDSDVTGNEGTSHSLDSAHEPSASRSRVPGAKRDRVRIRMDTVEGGRCRPTPRASFPSTTVKSADVAAALHVHGQRRETAPLSNDGSQLRMGIEVPITVSEGTQHGRATQSDAPQKRGNEPRL